MTLAIFDLDNTLICGDSDHAWGQFLVDQGLVDTDKVRIANDYFLSEYQAGTLNIDEYLEFTLAFLAGKSPSELAPLHQQFMTEVIEPMMLPQAIELIDQHRALGHQLLIITATNRFITEPIARRLGIEQLIACEPELTGTRYTGKATGTPSFGQGKVVRLQQWLDDRHESLDGAWFYSDSRNDLPLLEWVDNPIAVNPDEALKDIAQTNGWPILDLRKPA
ncbi:histidinol-phosphatase [Reinekea forsetii]|uniref:Phosphoserine phosphatase n=1 Tax=Reinekea forsetii TaxID=1336806 RepID=A0A2K8KU90_9GAMM|nr:HAD family hydrolase [Reinekea forsetii]ATX78297.1 phosphoserine phosphatase [Reinekea forsetii]MDO7640573.1 HAD-IB family hydrolase [Reinekea forsetii]MDO7645997.1 HAD-IB family hydrolase [Reinekea forsetii]